MSKSLTLLNGLAKVATFFETPKGRAQNLLLFLLLSKNALQS
ncbi:hypothetical protein [Hugenholtzia roseola]|nr:hypothetical protein [Hugenholtzia roseola]